MPHGCVCTYLTAPPSLYPNQSVGLAALILETMPFMSGSMKALVAL